MSGPVLVVVLLATYRISLLVTHDVITERPVKAVWGALQRRKWPDARPETSGPNYPQAQDAVLVARAQAPHTLVKLSECPWCGSWWYGLAIAGTGWVWGDQWWWFVPMAALAASAAAGVLTDLAHPEGRKDPEP